MNGIYFELRNVDTTNIHLHNGNLNLNVNQPYEYELKKLIEAGTVKQYGGVWCLINHNSYSAEKGVSFEAHDFYI